MCLQSKGQNEVCSPKCYQLRVQEGKAAEARRGGTMCWKNSTTFPPGCVRALPQHCSFISLNISKWCEGVPCPKAIDYIHSPSQGHRVLSPSELLLEHSLLALQNCAPVETDLAEGHGKEAAAALYRVNGAGRTRNLFLSLGNTFIIPGYSWKIQDK